MASRIDLQLTKFKQHVPNACCSAVVGVGAAKWFKPEDSTLNRVALGTIFGAGTFCVLNLVQNRFSRTQTNGGSRGNVPPKKDLETPQGNDSPSTPKTANQSPARPVLNDDSGLGSSPRKVNFEGSPNSKVVDPFSNKRDDSENASSSDAEISPLEISNQRSPSCEGVENRYDSHTSSPLIPESPGNRSPRDSERTRNSSERSESEPRREESLTSSPETLGMAPSNTRSRNYCHHNPTLVDEESGSPYPPGKYTEGQSASLQREDNTKKKRKKGRH